MLLAGGRTAPRNLTWGPRASSDGGRGGVGRGGWAHFRVSTWVAPVCRSESGGPHGAPVHHGSVCLLPIASYCLHGAWRQRPHSSRSTPPRDPARSQPQLLTFASAVVSWPGRSSHPRYWVRPPLLPRCDRLCHQTLHLVCREDGGEGNSPWNARSRCSFLQNAWNLEPAPKTWLRGCGQGSLESLQARSFRSWAALSTGTAGNTSTSLHCPTGDPRPQRSVRAWLWNPHLFLPRH